METCKCPVQSKTVYCQDYQDYGKIKPEKALEISQVDKEILTGYASNNLKVNGKIVTTKVWPDILNHAEEYEDFLKRFECCKYTNEVFKQNFQCPPVQIDIINNMIKNLGKTVYQVSYSPNDYTPKKEKIRVAKLHDSLISTKFYETTYRTSYNDSLHYERLNDQKHNLERSTKTLNEMRRVLKKMCICGGSTYHETISLPAKICAKSTPLAPIDRYTLRKT